jgi:hypothetical protein
MEVLGDSNQWNVSFVREAHNWEVVVFASFFQVLHLVMVVEIMQIGSDGSLSRNDCSRSSPSSAPLACSESRRFP